uniref:Uncharacterized protein n=1 Tax=Aegilops tauschii subsp. strangulata TaxID=200361 RepID=A0A453LEX5_AEGTS
WTCYGYHSAGACQHPSSSSPRRASSSNSWGSCRISLSWVMESAAIMAIPLANGGGKRLDWQDFISIITLLVNKHLLRLPCQRRVRPPAPSSTRLRHT